MKKTTLMVFAASLMMLLGVGSAQAQRMQMTAEQRAQRLKDTLALSDDQYGKVVTIFQDMDKKRQELFSAAGDDRDARMQAMRSLSDSTDTKIEALLNADQKTKYEDLKKQRMERMQNFRRRPQGE
ncbi:MAG TPA: hypothetical protein VEO56_11980 [Bacteroidota bacterium]|nr:hypothetical protein [Bacteroidota bacterium]